MKLKKRNILICLGIGIILLTSMFFLIDKNNNYHELPKVELKDDSTKKQYALMLEQTKGEGDYTPSSEGFPTIGYKLNTEKSNCVDMYGKIIPNALEYDYDNYSITLKTSKTAYCYLYYDIEDIKTYAVLDTKYSGTLYRTSEYKDKIVSATFVDYIPSEEELTSKPKYWDLSDTSKRTPEKSVIGWLEQNVETPENYDLYIGSNDKIYVTDLSYAIYYMTNLKEINFENLNTSEATNMSEMFAYDSKLTTLDLSGFDTSSVTDMSSMFSRTSANITFPQGFGSSATDMSYMFYDYTGTALDLSNFDTSYVINMQGMFTTTNSTGFTATINFPKKFGSAATDMSSMFSRYAGTALDLSDFDTSSVTDMSHMFYGVTATLPFKEWPNFVTNNVKDMSSMFFEYKGTTLDLSSFDTSSVTDMSHMFYGVTATLPFKEWPNFVTNNVKDMSSMFSAYEGTILDLSTFDTSSVTNMSSMFGNHYDYNAVSASIIFPKKFGSSATDMSYMFERYKGATLDLSAFDTSKVTDMSSMFKDYSIDDAILNVVENWNVSALQNVSSMFENNDIITQIDLSSWSKNLKNILNANKMFSNCDNLKVINVSGLKFNNTPASTFTSTIVEQLIMNDVTFAFDDVASYKNLFSSFGALKEIYLNNAIFQTENNFELSSMFQNRSSLVKVEMKNVDLSLATNMQYMFYYCTSLDSVDFTGTKITSVTNFNSMFYNCTKLKTIHLDNIKIGSLSSSAYSNMFYKDYKLENIYVPTDMVSWFETRMTENRITSATVTGV